MLFQDGVLWAVEGSDFTFSIEMGCLESDSSFTETFELLSPGFTDGGDLQTVLY